jgi:hypothetical protein
VHSATAIGRSWHNKWKRAAGAALTIVVLSAVTVVAIVLLGSKFLAACKAAGDAERALAPGAAIEELLNLDAPARWVARGKAHSQEADQSIQRAEEAAVLVKNWRYTQNPIADLVQLVFQQELNQIQALLAAISNFINQIQQILATILPAIGNIINSFVTAVQDFVSSILNSIFTSVTPINTSSNSSSSSSSNSSSPFH